MATPPRESGAGARRSVRVTILLDGLGGTKAACRRLPRQFMCGLAVPLAPPTGPSAGADRVAHFHAAGWASGPWMLYVTYDPNGWGSLPRVLVAQREGSNERANGSAIRHHTYAGRWLGADREKQSARKTSCSDRCRCRQASGACGVSDWLR